MWSVRHATKDDIEEISQLAVEYRDFVSPYVLNPKQIEAYLDEWLVAEDEGGTIGGGLHYVSTLPDKVSRNYAYLKHLKQVEPVIITEFLSKKNAVFLTQPTCPRKGSLRALINYLKYNYDELWSWLSVVSPVIRFYEEQLGIKFSEETYEFMNVYKGDFSTFRVGIWAKDYSNGTD